MWRDEDQNMKRHIAVLSLAALAAVSMASGAQAGTAGSKRSTQTEKEVTRLSFPPIQYKSRTLGNGLRVYSVQDKTTPTVAIQVWYHVGSKDDPQGRSGFAHLFEHIMFKSTKHMPDEMFDRLTEDVGGMNNAGTADDFTKYYEVVPSNYLETLLWAEGERLGTLKVDEKNFKSERDVVKEEFRFRILSPPYGRLFYALDKNSFSLHPYRRPGIGSIEELDAAGIDDVRAFHATYYRPDNAVLVVVGDFEQSQLDSWVDRYLAVIEKPSTPIPRVTVQEPARIADKRITEKAPNVPLPAVAMTWLIPAASSSDAAALTVAASILAQGESSRLYQSIVYRSQLAQDVSADADLREDAGLFVVRAILASGKSTVDAEKALNVELERVCEKQVSTAELEKAKNLLVTAELRRRETNDGKASAIGEAIILQHDAAEVNKGLAKLQAVSVADVQRVMKKYLGDRKRLVLTYVSEGEPNAKPSADAKGGRP
jgi:zinc protease